MVSGPLWQLSEVSFAVPGREILAPLSLSLAPGRVYGLIGPNGSGKSTLLKLLARQHVPSGGALLFENRPLADWRARDFARAVAYMPQFTPPTDGMSVRELVALARFPWHGTLGPLHGGDRAKVESAIARTDLARWPTAAWTASPAASGSARGWRSCWRRSRAACCWTSPRPPSTSPTRAKSSPSCAGSAARRRGKP